VENVRKFVVFENEDNKKIRAEVQRVLKMREAKKIKRIAQMKSELAEKKNCLVRLRILLKHGCDVELQNQIFDHRTVGGAGGSSMDLRCGQMIRGNTVAVHGNSLDILEQTS
jgi:hypothetical protein